MSRPIMCIHKTSAKPKQYDALSRERMEKAGVTEIIQLFEHSRDFRQFGFAGTEYHFNNGKVIKHPLKFKELVYGK